MTDDRARERNRRLALIPIPLRVSTYNKRLPDYVEYLQTTPKLRFRTYFKGSTADEIFAYIQLRMTKRTDTDPAVTLPSFEDILILIDPADQIKNGINATSRRVRVLKCLKTSRVARLTICDV